MVQEKGDRINILTGNSCDLRALCPARSSPVWCLGLCGSTQTLMCPPGF